MRLAEVATLTVPEDTAHLFRRLTDFYIASRYPEEIEEAAGSLEMSQMQQLNRDIIRLFPTAARVRFVPAAEQPARDPVPQARMIGFDLTDEQRLLEQTVREWAAREVAPRIRELDREHRFDRDRILGGMA